MDILRENCTYSSIESRKTEWSAKREQQDTWKSIKHQIYFLRPKQSGGLFGIFFLFFHKGGMRKTSLKSVTHSILRFGEIHISFSCSLVQYFRYLQAVLARRQWGSHRGAGHSSALPGAGENWGEHWGRSMDTCSPHRLLLGPVRWSPLHNRWRSRNREEEGNRQYKLTD